MTIFKSGKFVILGAACVLALSACSNVKKEMGFDHPAPDEFTVVKRAPLAMPPDYSLRPPEPGAPRPQEMATDEQAKQTVFGGDDKGAAPQARTTGEAMLLQQAGANQALPGIRQVVDRETAAMAPAQEPAMKKLFDIGKDRPPAASVVDAPAEAARLKKDQDSGQPPSAGGETPAKTE